ncbi:MAG TPA: tRNA (N6-isopentenyl adenosine(37)-C2)-methylthiotransferase MiaB [Leptospiraceae bacterium]|nr:tRNA (N6-isopentenyl adenosine(37)-C2)-methylthiotransferase MiaB [Leptospiraceae bacterium]
MAESRKVYLETYGCQMNEYDSGLVRKILEGSYSAVGEPEQADLILLNTCAIREKAHEKVYSRLESFHILKRKRPDLVIGVLGCMAQNLGEDLFSQGLPLDFIAGPDNYRNLPELIESSQSGSSERMHTRLSQDETYGDIQPTVTNGVLASVTIMRGCDNFCSFCVVPYTRGRERSRSIDSIVEEVSRLIEEEGVREVMLLGQNVNSYKYEGHDFAALVERLLSSTSIARIRFTSPHPHDFPDHLLSLMASEERFCSQIHLPVQSGSTSVLSRMKRDYSREEYLALVAKMKDRIPEVGLSTDIIVGFCGETESEFEDTLSLVKECRFDVAYMFRYSEREGTFAKKKMPDDIPEEVKLERLARLISVQSESSLAKNQEEIGKVHRVLVEGRSKRSAADNSGRSDSGKKIIFPAAGTKPGEIVPVRIESVTSATMRGTVVAPVFS